MAATDTINAKWNLDVKGALAAITKVQSAFKKIEEMLLGLGLSILFTGMAIKNFFQNMLAAMLGTFETVHGQQSLISNDLNNLRAMWEYLKFSFMDAARETGVWDKWMEKIERIMDKIDQLDTATKGTFVDAMVWAVIAGAAMMLFGQAALFLLGPLAILKVLGPVVSAGLWWIFLAVAAIIGLMVVWKSDMDTMEKILWSVVIVAGMLALAFALINLPLTLIFTLVMLLAAWFLYLKKNSTSWTDALMLSLLHVGKFLIEFLIGPMLTLINMWREIKGLSRIDAPGVKFIDEQIAEIKQRAADERAAKNTDAQSNQVFNFDIQQLPGEDSEALAQRVADLISNANYMNEGSTQR